MPRALLPILGVALLALIPLLGLTGYHLHILIMILLWGLIYTGWSIMGRFGLVSLGHGAFMGIGAYGVTMLWNHFGLTPWIGIPLALPYFAVISQILKANLTLTESLTVLGIYNVAFVLPYAVVPVMIAMMGDRAKPALERFSDRIVGFGMRAVPWFVFLLGAWLIFDAAYYWVVGTPII